MGYSFECRCTHSRGPCRSSRGSHSAADPQALAQSDEPGAQIARLSSPSSLSLLYRTNDEPETENKKGRIRVDAPIRTGKPTTLRTLALRLPQPAALRAASAVPHASWRGPRHASAPSR